MIYTCPKCGMWAMAWDGRAKVFMCHYVETCGHVVRAPGWRTEPPADVASSLIRGSGFGKKCIVQGCVNHMGEDFQCCIYTISKLYVHLFGWKKVRELYSPDMPKNVCFAS
jgi:hypothetical protein